MSKIERIGIQIHPRAFAAFGEDLVTNDLVAVTELVKNSYDAYAFKVKLEFGRDEFGEEYIKISDDGLGMTKKVILGAWATIATPYKKKNPIVIRNVNGVEKLRRVSGNKGLGRFSAARLGNEMYMITKSKEGTCLKAFFDWTEFEKIEIMNECGMTLEEVDDTFFKESGTIIIIKKLKEKWTKEKIIGLSSELSRLISPFDEISDFSIEIDSESFDDEPLKVKTKEFINKPIYKITGLVDECGNIKYRYTYNMGKTTRLYEDEIEWKYDNYKERYSSGTEKIDKYKCGKFDFELRVWDLDSESITDVAERFNIGKKEIRDDIRLYKGISVYRDKVLVLPKSETARDWLGLDAKRISQIGRRISTSQVIGIVNISNENNPEIKDTTDREKLVDNTEYKQFTYVLEAIINALQNEREKDKVEGKKKATLSDIIAPLSARGLLEKVEEAVETGKDSRQLLEYVRDYQKENEKRIEDLNERLIYYAQTASLGSVAIVIMHEFLTGMTCIKRFLNKAKGYVSNFDKRTNEYLEDAENSHKRILEVTQSFSPLYKRELRKEKNICNLYEIIQKSIRLIKAKKASKDVKFNVEVDKDITVMISQSELQTIFINLFDNSCFWTEKSDYKIIKISTEKSDDNGKIVVVISDSGCGIDEKDVEKIFIPGITSKPKGIGMGLVIVTELLNNYDGKIGVRVPGDLKGATFLFDLPVEKGKK